MKQDSFSYEITARCSPEKALKMLSEFSQHSAIHPLIIHVEQIPAPAGVVRRYLITDQLKWGHSPSKSATGPIFCISPRPKS